MLERITSPIWLWSVALKFERSFGKSRRTRNSECRDLIGLCLYRFIKLRPVVAKLDANTCKDSITLSYWVLDKWSFMYTTSLWKLWNGIALVKMITLYETQLYTTYDFLHQIEYKVRLRYSTTQIFTDTSLLTSSLYWIHQMEFEIDIWPDLQGQLETHVNFMCGCEI